MAERFDLSVPPPQIADYPRPADRTPRPACSVVTVSFNSAKTLERTIDSVHAQAVACEHVLIDGGSTDGTLELIRRRARPGDVVVSEPDRGISDAINKGLALASGEAVAIVHSDDWLGEGQIAKALAALEASGAPMVFGDVVSMVDGAPWLVEHGDPDYAKKLDRRMPNVPHPSILYARAVFETVGLYRTDLRLAMDYEWLLRAERMGQRAVYAPGIVANMTYDGVSNTAFARTVEEVRQIVVAYGRNPLVARAEAWGRLAKTALGRASRRIDPRLYGALRRLINRQIASAPSAGAAAE